MSEASTAAVNTNTATVSEPVVSGGGEAPVSWDQLESVSNFKQQTAKEDAKVEMQAEKEAKKELGEKITEEKTQKSGVKKAPKDKQESADAKPESKKLKVKHEEQDLEIPTDVKVPVKINGKLEEVPLQEALNRYSQQKHLDKIYQEFKKEKAAFEKERGTIKTVFDQIKQSLVDKKDLRGLIEAVAEPLGLEADELFGQMTQKFEQEFEEAQLLSPEERKAKRAEEELAYFKQKQLSERQRQMEEKQRQELETKVEQVIAEAKMEKQDFVQAYDELVTLGYKPEEISPEQITSYWSNLQTINLIEAKIAEFNPEAAQDSAEVERVAEMLIRNGATPDEIEEVVKQLYLSDADKKLAKKINKSIAKAKAETPVKHAGKDPMFFDDI